MAVEKEVARHNNVMEGNLSKHLFMCVFKEMRL